MRIWRTTRIRESMVDMMYVSEISDRRDIEEMWDLHFLEDMKDTEGKKNKKDVLNGMKKRT